MSHPGSTPLRAPFVGAAAVAAALALSGAAPPLPAAPGDGPGPAPAAAAGRPTADDPGSTGHSLGPPDAPVVVTEFSDFGCPYCAVFARTVFPELRRDYIDTGRVRWLHVPFVLGPFGNSEAALSAAECAADEGGYWDFHALLFHRQVEWKDGDPARTVFPRYAGEAGLDEGAFRACLADGPRDEVARGNDMALVAGVGMTPTFFIDGRRLEGAVSLESFREIIDEALERASGGPLGDEPG